MKQVSSVQFVKIVIIYHESLRRNPKFDKHFIIVEGLLLALKYSMVIIGLFFVFICSNAIFE